MWIVVFNSDSIIIVVSVIGEMPVEGNVSLVLLYVVPNAITLRQSGVVDRAIVIAK